jgi:DNA ligase-1
VKHFSNLYWEIDSSNKTGDKVAALVRYFESAPPEDAAWAVAFLLGRRPKRAVSSTRMQLWASQLAGIPPWLFGECYDAVGDLAETIALVLPNGESSADLTLGQVVEQQLRPLAGMSEDAQRETLTRIWLSLGRDERFVFNKLLTGAFRVGVSQELVTRALSQVSGLPPATISHRLMGDWVPSGEFFRLLFGADDDAANLSRPYPFCLAHSLDEGAVSNLGNWVAEWKWDGIRTQVIRRGGHSFVWSRGEELITERFPEIADLADNLPDGTVIDGEIVAWEHELPMPFTALQRRIGRKVLTKKLLTEVPVKLIAFDLLELGGMDIREQPLSARKDLLVDLVAHLQTPPAAGAFAAELGLPPPKLHPYQDSIRRSECVSVESWDLLADQRANARDANVEGLMLKRLDAPYVGGRKKGIWWKWKIDPLTVDAVILYAQRGSGRRASLYTDFTFGVWDGDKLVPIAKAYSGLTDQELQKVDAWVRRHTLEKFGPVRTVKPELVMELAFEGIQLSSRHKSGIAVRFPRIVRWRHDKTPAEADTLQSVKDLIAR